MSAPSDWGVRRGSLKLGGDGPLLWIGMGVVLVVTSFFAVLVDELNYDVWSAIVTFFVIIAITIPILGWVSSVDGDRRTFAILFAALLIRLLASLARYYILAVTYGGVGDAGRYHYGAIAMANHIKDGYYEIDLGPRLANNPPETRRIGFVTGLIYLVTGPSVYSGYFVFTWFAFLGQLASIRAFRIAVPEGNHRLYAMLVMFVPSLIYWPSSIGKEACMVLSIGVASYGVARIFARRSIGVGFACAALGLVGAGLIRPHVALLLGLGVASAFVVQSAFPQARVGLPRRGRDTAVRLVALTAVAIFVIGAASAARDNFGTVGDGASDVSGAFAATIARTEIGGSAFPPTPVRTPLDLPMATISVILRPFPWDARNLQSLVSATEGPIVLLFYLNRRRLRSIPSLIVRYPYIAFCLGYMLVFIVAFSNIGNAGILARQRVQVLPMTLTIAAMPIAARARTKSEKRRTHRDETQRSYADDPRGAEPVLAHRDSSGVVS